MLKLTVLNQKYKPGCSKGIINFTTPDLLGKLNSVIDWENSKFPIEIKEDPTTKEKTEVELREFLGKEPKLSPGNVFLINGQIIAVNSEEELYLIVTETGKGALKRIWEELVEPVLDYRAKSTTAEMVIVQPETPGNIPEDWIRFSPPYKNYKLWRDSCLKDEYKINSKGDICIRVIYYSGIIDRTVEIIMVNWSIYFDPMIVPEDSNKMSMKLADEIITWFMQND